MSRKRGHSLDTDAKLFFALGNALMDASIAAWAAKYRWDFVRPITAIRSRYKGKLVTSWLGPPTRAMGRSPGSMDPVSVAQCGHPAVPRVRVRAQHLQFGRRGHPGPVHRQRQLRRQRDHRGGTSLFEPKNDAHPTGYTPAHDITLSWPTLTAAAKDAGLSRRLGGIHFQDGDEHGYNLGQRVGGNVLAQTMGYVNGTIAG